MEVLSNGKAGREGHRQWPDEVKVTLNGAAMANLHAEDFRFVA